MGRGKRATAPTPSGSERFSDTVDRAIDRVATRAHRLADEKQLAGVLEHLRAMLDWLQPGGEREALSAAQDAAAMGSTRSRQAAGLLHTALARRCEAFEASLQKDIEDHPEDVSRREALIEMRGISREVADCDLDALKSEQRRRLFLAAKRIAAIRNEVTCYAASILSRNVVDGVALDDIRTVLTYAQEQLPAMSDGLRPDDVTLDVLQAASAVYRAESFPDRPGRWGKSDPFDLLKGDRAERRRAAYLSELEGGSSGAFIGTMRRVREPAPAADRNAINNAARSLLAHPEWWMCPAGVRGRMPVALQIPASAQAAAEFATDNPHVRDVAVRIEGDRLMRYFVAVHVVAEAVIDGRLTETQVTVDARGAFARADDEQTFAAAALEQLGLADVAERCGGYRIIDGKFAPLDPVYDIRAAEGSRPVDGGTQSLTVDEVFPPAPCLHANASWQVLDSGYPVARALSCPDCHSPRVKVAMLHQFPNGEDIADTVMYRRAVRIRELLRGRDDPDLSVSLARFADVNGERINPSARGYDNDGIPRNQKKTRSAASIAETLKRR